MQQPDLRTITAPGKLALSLTLSDGSILLCDEVVRVIPNKRLVCRGIWQQKTVYVKLFIDARAAHYFARDLAGVTDLLAAKISTPALLLQGQIQSNVYILVFEAVANGLNAEQAWQKLDAKARFSLTKNLVQEIAKHHNAGLLQTDLYLKNFLVENDKIYSLDGDGIRKYTKLSKSQMQRNLATLFSKFDVLEDDRMPELYEAYCAQTGIEYSVFDEAEIWASTQKIRRQIASHYADKKVFRQCTDVKKYALGAARILVCRDAENIDFPGNLDTLLTPQSLLKDGNTCTVALAEIGGKKIVIKRYNIKNFWHGLNRAFRQTRAAKSWANAHRLKILGIATAAPIALIEQRKFGLLKGKAYFLAEYILAPDARESVSAPDAAQFFAKNSNKTARAEAVNNITTLFYKLYLLKISHGDMKASNIKMVDSKPVLIDLDSMQQHRFAFTFEKAHARDLRRFMQNWQNEPALYNAFVSAFKLVYEDDAPLKLAKLIE